MYSKYLLLLIFIFSSNDVYSIPNPFKKKNSSEQKKDSLLDQATETLKQIKDDLQAIRVVVADALEKNIYKESNLKAPIDRIKKNGEKIDILESLKQEDKEELKMQAQIVSLTFKALLEEIHVLDLWVNGYKEYEDELNDNFKKLPNKYLQKPDIKKLYQELGYKDQEGQKKSFNEIRQKYQQKFNDLKNKAGTEFNGEYFIPYLRVLDYVFRTPYSKLQYDSYLAGITKYNEKADKLKKYKDSIHDLFSLNLTYFNQLNHKIRSF